MTLNLSSDLVSRNCIESGAYLLYSLRYEFQIWCVKMHLAMTECHIPFSGHFDLNLKPIFKNYCVQSISLIFFEVGSPNLVCICILGWRSVTYHFQVTVTMTSDLVLRIIVSRAYLLYDLR